MDWKAADPSQLRDREWDSPPKTPVLPKDGALPASGDDQTAKDRETTISEASDAPGPNTEIASREGAGDGMEVDG